MKVNSLTTNILYILSVVLLLIGSIQLFQATSYILDSVNQGYIAWGSDFDTILSYISQACTNTYCFSVIFYVLAKMYHTLMDDKNKTIEN